MSKHVLIAEDHAFLASTLGDILRRENVRVTLAYDGRETIEALKKEVPDLLLLDVLMPVLDGHAVLDAMQTMKLECPVIVLTNLSDQKTRDECAKKKVKHFFVKNELDDDALWPSIEKYLR